MSTSLGIQGLLIRVFVAQGLWLGFIQAVSQGCSHLQTWLRLENMLCRWHIHGWKVGANGWCKVCFFTGCFNVLTTWQLAAYRASGLRKTKIDIAMSLMTQSWDHTLFLLQYSVGNTRQPWFRVRGDYTKTWIPGEENNWRPSWILLCV